MGWATLDALEEIGGTNGPRATKSGAAADERVTAAGEGEGGEESGTGDAVEKVRTGEVADLARKEGCRVREREHDTEREVACVYMRPTGPQHAQL